MHSRIIQISKNPIDRDDWVNEDRYINCFVGSVAEYVSEDTDRDSDIEWLKELLKGAAEFDGDKFTIVNKNRYFRSKFDKFKVALEEMRDVDLKDFINTYNSKNLSVLIFDLNAAYSDKYGFYMDDNDEYAGNDTLDNFMRRAKDGDTFYIGTTLDYHF